MTFGTAELQDLYRRPRAFAKRFFRGLLTAYCGLHHTAHIEVPMKKIIYIILASLLLIGGTARAQDGEKVAKAQAAAQSWLALSDAGDYGQSWERAAALFQAAVSKSDWHTALQKVRSPLGSLKSRTVKSATFTRSLPGAPEGEYVVIQYETSFEHMAGAIETVTPMREKDGSWKVSGYFIK